MTGCTSLPNPALPDGRLWKSGAVDLLRGVLAAFWGSPSYGRGCRFPSSIPSQVQTPSDTQESFFGSICCQPEKRSSARTGWTQLVQEVSAQGLPSPHELLNQIPCAKPEFPPNADCSAQTGLGCALCSWLAPRPGFAWVGFRGAAAVGPHHNPALNIHVCIPWPGFSIKKVWELGKVQVL